MISWLCLASLVTVKPVIIISDRPIPTRMEPFLVQGSVPPDAKQLRELGFSILQNDLVCLIVRINVIHPDDMTLAKALTSMGDDLSPIGPRDLEPNAAEAFRSNLRSAQIPQFLLKDPQFKIALGEEYRVRLTDGERLITVTLAEKVPSSVPTYRLSSADLLSPDPEAAELVKGRYILHYAFSPSQTSLAKSKTAIQADTLIAKEQAEWQKQIETEFNLWMLKRIRKNLHGKATQDIYGHRSFSDLDQDYQKVVKDSLAGQGGVRKGFQSDDEVQKFLANAEINSIVLIINGRLGCKQEGSTLSGYGFPILDSRSILP